MSQIKDLIPSIPAISALATVRFSSNSGLAVLVWSLGLWNQAMRGGILVEMTNVTEILYQIKQGDPGAPEQLLPLVYDELRKLAAAKLAHENSGQTLQATALVHEAYLRLVDVEKTQRWDSRGHFFAAAAEAMRRILVEAARRKGREKHGGRLDRRELVEDCIALPVPSDELLAVHEALGNLEAANPQAAQLIKLRYFAGFTIPETAEHMGISPRKANQIWTYARAWLAADIADTREN